jgi:hypothetical protein
MQTNGHWTIYFELSVGHWGNQGRNLKIPRIKWKWSYNLSELLG